MKTLDEFRQFYETELRDVLTGLEEQRRKISKMFREISLVVLAILVVFVSVILISGTSPFIIIAGAVVGGIFIALAWWLLTKDFVVAFKKEVIGSIVKFCDPSLTYMPKRHIPESQFRDSNIFQHSIDRFRGEDYVDGKIGATAVAFSEIHAEYKTTTTDSKGRTRTQWHTIFKGLFFIADFNKHFQGITVVLPDVAERLFGFLGKKLQEMNVFRSGQLIKLEDPEFEKLFVVYGGDQVEARYILSPSLMERISDFKKKTGKQIYLSFARSNVHVAIETNKNMFEPRIFKSLFDFELLKEYLEDLQLALGIVDDLNLNRRIWSKK